MAQPTSVAFVGTGYISGPYASSFAHHPELILVGAFDVDAGKAAHFAAANGCARFANLDELDAARPDIVVNLTNAPYHYATTKELLQRGHTVFSEKPLALTTEQARELIELARSSCVRLACAPSIWLAPASLDVAERVRSGMLGDVRFVTAEVDQGRIETWHPAPQTFYQVGPVFDAGVYPLTYLTSVLGPITDVTAMSAGLLPERRTLSGETLTVSTDDAWIAAARFATGALLRLTCTFFVDAATAPRSIDFHGVDGSLRLHDWVRSDSPILHAGYGEPFTELVPGVGEAEPDWCLGVADLAEAMRDDRPHRVTAEQAAHVVEVLEAIRASAAEGVSVAVSSTFASPFAGPAA